ncbi:MAG: diaminopimelate epimerase [Candidatus Omnitrophota bacterium]
MNKIVFAKMVATGNDFVVIDHTGKGAPRVTAAGLSALAREICSRKTGAGADGLLCLEPSAKADFKMRILNPDGSEPAMCGNGARCAALFFVESNARARKRGSVRFDTGAGILEAHVAGDQVKLRMSPPKDLWQNIDLNVGNQFCKVHYINTGVPHAVLFVPNVETVNVRDVGRQIRAHKHFHPEGTNVNFVQVIDAKTLRVRTYERGVEDETLACGTGSTASALIAHYLKLTKKMPLLIRTHGGETLTVYFEFDGTGFSDVWLEGRARKVYDGSYGQSGQRGGKHV